MTLQSVLDEIRERPGTGDVISIINPVTEEQIAEFTDCGEEAVNEAVARAKAAFEAGVWSELPGRARAKVMWRIADLIDEHADGTRATRLAEHRHAVDAGDAGAAQLRRILPLLRGLVLQDQRQRLRREDRGHRHGHLGRHAHLHAQGAVQRCGPYLPVERSDLQRVREARACARGGLQHGRQTRRGDPAFGAAAQPTHRRSRACRTASSTC